MLLHLSRRERCRRGAGSSKSLLVACAAALLSLSGLASPNSAAAQTYKVTSQITLPTAIPGVDIAEVNAQLGLYAVADRGGSIDLINVLSNKLVAQLGGFVGTRVAPVDSGPNGVVFRDNAEIWGGDGNSTVRVYNLASNSLVTVIPIPNGTPTTRTDEGCYDPINKVTLWANDRSKFVSFISTTTYTVLSQIVMNGTVNGGSVLPAPNATNGIEQCRFNPRNGLIYQNIPQENGNGTSGNAPGAVVVYNGATRSIVQIFRPTLTNCSNPTGMAIGPVGPGGGQIMLACTNTGGGQGPLIINENTGAAIANFPNDAPGADEINYNPGNSKYIGGATGHIGIIDPFSLTSTPFSPGVSRNVVGEPIFNQLYSAVTNVAAMQALHLCSALGGNDALGCFLVSSTTGASASYASTHDFNVDGKSDILWRATDGTLAMWLMNGTQALQTASLGPVGTNWSVVGQRDFNGDQKYDLLWRATDGTLAMWLMNGTQVLQSASLGQVGTNWTVGGTCDFNGDGKGDIVWRASDGTVAIWLMNGTQVLQSASLGQVGTNWTIVGTGDLNNDGRCDLIWRATDGTLAVWLMNGTQVLQSASLGQVGTNWTVVGTGDLNGDGKYDIVWRATDGTLAIWLMNGTQILQSASLGQVGTNWAVQTTGDFNGDTKSDLLWRATDGTLAMWLMNGTQVLQSASLGQVGTNWVVQTANAD
jgi:hypothetical protein